MVVLAKMKYWQLYTLLFMTALMSCEPNEDLAPIDTVPVREEVFINTPQALPLENFPFYIYIQGGLRGIIVHKTGPQQYIAMERTCTLNPNKDCQFIEVDQSGLFMTDTCCKSRWDMQGNVIQGPAFRPLGRYGTIFSPPNRILITNLR